MNDLLFQFCFLALGLEVQLQAPALSSLSGCELKISLAGQCYSWVGWDLGSKPENEGFLVSLLLITCASGGIPLLMPGYRGEGAGKPLQAGQGCLRLMSCGLSGFIRAVQQQAPTAPHHTAFLNFSSLPILPLVSLFSLILAVCLWRRRGSLEKGGTGS